MKTNKIIAVNRLFILFLIIFYSGKVYSQIYDSNKVKQIDSIIHLLPGDFKNEEYYMKTESYGNIEHKKFKLFREQIGEFKKEVVYHDSIVFSIYTDCSYYKNNKRQYETYYYSDNKLIKFIEKVSFNSEGEKKVKFGHNIEIYFDDNHIIAETGIINDDYELNKSRKKIILKNSITEITYFLKYNEY